MNPDDRKNIRHRERIRIAGFRAIRFYRRIMAFFGMLLLCSVAAIVADDWLSEIIIILASSSLLLYGFFKNKQKRADGRQSELSIQAAEVCPEASLEDLSREYERLRRKEKRVEALLYLIFAAVALLWFIVFLSGDFVSIGALIISALSLLVCLGLLLSSFETWDTSGPNKYMKEYANDQQRRKSYAERSRRADHRSLSYLADVADMEDTSVFYGPDAKRTAFATAREMLKNYAFVSFIEHGFFVMIPLLLTLVTLFIGAGDLSRFFGIILVFSSSLWYYLVFITDAETVSPLQLLYWSFLTRIGRCTVSEDAILSCSSFEGRPKMMEICFDHAGTYWCKWRGSKSKLLKMIDAAGSKATLIHTGKGCLAVLISYPRAPEARIPVGTVSKDTPIRILSDCEIAAEARQRLASMDPADVALIEAEIKECIQITHDYVTKMIKGQHISRAQEGEYWRAESRLSNHSYDDIELEGIEKGIMDMMHHMSRAQIAAIKHNPFGPSFRRTLFVTAAVGIGGNVGTALISKLTGAELWFLYILFSSATGYLALRTAEQLIRMGRFKKLQKTYKDPEFYEKKIQAMVFESIRDRVKAEMER